MDYASFLPFCETPRQVEVIEGLIKAGSQRKAALLPGMPTARNIGYIVKRVKQNAELSGIDPASHKYVAPGQRLTGLSTMVKTEDGMPQWIKTATDREALQAELDEMRDQFAASIPRAKPVKASAKSGPDDLLNLHIVTDYHLGMLSWGEESGEDWDIKIAEQLLYDWFGYTIKNAPAAHTGVLAQLGDLLHVDGFDAVTPASKHQLDADTRFQKTVRVAIRSMRTILSMMLKKYQQVHVIMADANHDPASAAWLREVFYQFYADEPRITVDNSPSTYYCYEHGKTSLFFHHGHRKKPSGVDSVFVQDFREVFGRTKHSFAHMGHMHHWMGLETNLMVVEQHRTMAAKDAYAAHGGWRAGRGAPVITYHKEYGDIGRLNITPELL